MPSPFPGIDPYIESSGMWGDFHTSMIVGMRNELNARLPSGFAANVELYVWYHEPEAKKRRRIAPDVYLTKFKGAGKHGMISSVAAPRTIVLAAPERRRQKYVLIRDIHGDRVVTAIEFLSPSNKAAGEDREAYLIKRNDLLAKHINLVEIDLVRGGQRLPLSDPPPEMGDFYVMVCRGWNFPRADFWPMTIRDPIPEVSVPLAEEMADVRLPLQPCIDQVYELGRYAPRLDYGKALSPRLTKKDSKWARERLAAREI